MGWGGNNGTTVTGAVLANKHNITWRTKEGVQVTNTLFGSICHITFLNRNGSTYLKMHTLLLEISIKYTDYYTN